MTAADVRQEDDRNRKGKLLPVDVAGYVAVGKDGKAADHYAVLWVKDSGDDDARIYAGITGDFETEVGDRLKEAKLIPRTLQATIGSDGGTKYCGVWGRLPATVTTGQTDRYQVEGNFKQKQADLGDQSLIDLAVSGASKPETTRDRVLAAVKRADTKLKTKPDDRDARLSRALAHFRLGDNQKALEDLQVVIAKNPESVPAKEHKVLALAALGRKQDAKSELAKLQKEGAPEHSQLFIVAALAAELCEGADEALEALTAEVRKQPEDADLRYDGARAFSLASKSISLLDKAKGRQLAERCLELLREAVKNDDGDFDKIDEDADLDPIRDLPAFAEIMEAAHPERRYSAVWSSDASFEAVPIYGLDPAAQVTKCRELIAQGYRPASWSVSRTTSQGPLVTASVWHRPVVSEEFKDRLTERQARAAVALVRVGRAKSVWLLLRHSSDPRLRSFIVNWLSPLGANLQAAARELAQLDSTATRHSPPASQRMDAILFHPETSMRRALIQALGAYGIEGLSPGEHEPLVSELVGLYCNDPRQRHPRGGGMDPAEVGPASQA